MTRIAPVLSHLYQECLAFSVVEGWLYPISTHAGALIPSGAVFGHSAADEWEAQPADRYVGQLWYSYGGEEPRCYYIS